MSCWGLPLLTKFNPRNISLFKFVIKNYAKNNKNNKFVHRIVNNIQFE